MGTGKHRRLVAANRDLLRKERLISEILGLRVVPRLSLLDEASATYVTGDERGDLDDNEGEASKTPDERRT